MTDKPSRGKRIQFGEAELSISRATSVFINCPFDPSFVPLFDAIIFTAACYGFLPRSALETGNVAEPRMERITRAIFTSKYSIHDLSRCKGEGDEQLARFNMPLELGIAMAQHYGMKKKADQHDWLVLVPEGHQYYKFISDLAAFDPRTYADNVETLIPPVASWLATRPDATGTLNAKQILAALPAYTTEVQKLQDDWGGDVPWAERILAARRNIPEF